jgi:hypothetical protein
MCHPSFVPKESSQSAGLSLIIFGKCLHCIKNTQKLNIRNQRVKTTQKLTNWDKPCIALMNAGLLEKKSMSQHKFINQIVSIN